MRANAAPVEGNKVRLSVEIDESEVDEALDGVMKRLSREVRVPGFRPGKVPRRVIEARMGGAGALRSEALREALPGFYARAVRDTEVDPIDQPEIDITSGDDAGAVSFDAVVLVRPAVAVPGYRGLSVTLPDLDVTDEEIAEQLDRLRALTGQLAEVSRPARDGDRVTIDVHGTGSGSSAGSGSGSGAGGDGIDAEDLLYEVGAGGVARGLDDQLRGAKAGDILSFEESGPDGRNASFRVLVKDVKELVLPEMTDDWAAEASEFDTVDDLRSDLADRLHRQHVLRARIALEQRTAEALAGLVSEEIPEQLVDAAMRNRVHDLSRRLDSQGMSLGRFLEATGQSEGQFVDGLRESALQSVKLDLALRAVIAEEGIEVTDEELAEELAAMGERLDVDTEELRGRLERAGRLAAVRSDRRMAKAMRWLVDNVELVDEEGKPVSREALAVEEGEEGSG